MRADMRSTERRGGCSASLVWVSDGQRRLYPVRQWNLSHVQRHRHHHVVAAETDNLGYSPLAESPDSPFIGLIRDTVRLVQLGAERIERLLLLGLELRTAAMGDRVDDRIGKSAFARQAGMRIPLVLSRPGACRDDDRHLRQRRRKRCLVSQERAETLCPVRKLRTAKQGIERSAHTSPRPAGYFLEDLALLLRQILWGKRGEAFHGRVSVIPVVVACPSIGQYISLEVRFGQEDRGTGEVDEALFVGHQIGPGRTSGARSRSGQERIEI